ncbi:DUF397 domain-containing protein [Kitasatospora sp. MBT66]|uniref:DUF397 domain-containing protein n=1 Tax=Kitasatospora sp. MBT66 TaxID=1444769 RepID=UPI0005BE77AE|nr:DUF397 domain-containing protein [Kitasatospora sp. MBT66]
MNTTDLDAARLADQLAGAEWQTASSGGTNCVEVTFLDSGLVAFRDSLNPEQQPLLSTDEGFQSLTASVLGGLLQRPKQLGADPITATTKNELAPDWLAVQLAKAVWQYPGPESIGVAFLPRAITVFCGPDNARGQHVLVFADSEINDFSEGIRVGKFRRREAVTPTPPAPLALVH